MTGVSRDASSWDDLGEQALIPLSQIGCDAFECALLPIIRDLTLTCRCPEGKSWIPIYGDAEKRWGARTGLPLVHRSSLRSCVSRGTRWMCSTRQIKACAPLSPETSNCCC